MTEAESRQVGRSYLDCVLMSLTRLSVNAPMLTYKPKMF